MMFALYKSKTSRLAWAFPAAVTDGESIRWVCLSGDHNFSFPSIALTMDYDNESEIGAHRVWTENRGREERDQNDN